MEQVASACENHLLYGEIKDAFAASFSATKADMGNLITSTEGTQWTAVI